ncbi:MAG: FUN14 domain-containing protein [Verrucomicrobiota bacterium]
MVSDDRSPVSSSLAAGNPPANSGVQSSALFRFGFSYAGGFLIGWLFRKSLKLALLATGVLALAVAAGKYSGLFNLDWAAIEATPRTASPG